MGVDAVMFTRTPEPVAPDEIHHLGVDLCDAFGHSNFFLSETVGFERRAIYVADAEDLEYYMLEAAGANILTVGLFGRFYGPQYQRGDLPTILAIAKWLRSRIPDVTVFYGGDCDVGVRELNDEYEGELWTHFVTHGHRLYYSDHGFPPRIEPPDCQFCLTPMWNQSTGPLDKKGFSCTSCGSRVETSDGGKTWVQTHDAPGVELTVDTPD